MAGRSAAALTALNARQRARAGWICGLAAMLAPTLGFAECAPLKQVTALDLVGTQGGLRLVPVSINGTPRNLLLGTAAGFSILMESAVADLGLHPLSTERDVRLLTRNGHALSTYVVVNTFQIGNVQGKDLAFMVAPDRQAGNNPGSPIAGVLAGDMMAKFDVEMDFAANKLKYFSPDHCDGRVIYWPAAVIAVVPYSPERSGSNRIDSHLRVPVTLDGRSLTAMIDTGSVRSTLSEEVARELHVTADSPGAVTLGTVENDPNHKVFGYMFGSLAFEGVTVSKPRIVVFPDLVGSKDPSNRLRTGGHIQHIDDQLGPELTIGMDILKNLHLYVATREHKLYITPAATAEGSAPAAGGTQ